jgi:hypothetical protein
MLSGAEAERYSARLDFVRLGFFFGVAFSDSVLLGVPGHISAAKSTITNSAPNDMSRIVIGLIFVTTAGAIAVVGGGVGTAGAVVGFGVGADGAGVGERVGAGVGERVGAAVVVVVVVYGR